MEQRLTACITGGGGYVGHRLGCALAGKGFDVILYDLRPPLESLVPGVSFVQGTINDYSTLCHALRCSDVVFHLASYGMSGRENCMHKLVYQINVEGTRNVIKACIENNITCLVYTSTVNVVFNGKQILNGDESMPYPPEHSVHDVYSRTKMISEKLVLAANMTPLGEANQTDLKSKAGLEDQLKIEDVEPTKEATVGSSNSYSELDAASNGFATSQAYLRTCSIRPCGIYGPGEQRHILRVLRYAQMGLWQFVFGSPDVLVEWLHVDNLVESLILAAEHLTVKHGYNAAGQAYFISDGKPMNNFDFFYAIVGGLGYPCPTLRLPLSVVYFLGWLMELAFAALNSVASFEPFLTRHEVLKCGITHYFSINKAKTELGYVPKEYSIESVIDWYREHGYARPTKQSNGGASSAWLMLLLLLFVVLLAFYYVPAMHTVATLAGKLSYIVQSM